MPAKKTAKRHQRRAAKLGGLRDIRDIFLALLEESALTRSCDSRSLEAARAHPKAFRLIYEITDAMRRDKSSAHFQVG